MALLNAGPNGQGFSRQQGVRIFYFGGSEAGYADTPVVDQIT
tara:strand:+ start:128 stop:253 length:126 start_codon:yes stop_codon:yes gene_type:complete